MFHNYNPARSPTADIWSPYDTNHFTALLGDPIQLAAKVVSVIAAFVTSYRKRDTSSRFSLS
jgi:hypothetical protein